MGCIRHQRKSSHLERCCCFCRSVWFSVTVNIPADITKTHFSSPLFLARQDVILLCGLLLDKNQLYLICVRTEDDNDLSSIVMHKLQSILRSNRIITGIVPKSQR